MSFLVKSYPSDSSAVATTYWDVRFGSGCDSTQDAQAYATKVLTPTRHVCQQSLNGALFPDVRSSRDMLNRVDLGPRLLWCEGLNPHYRFEMTYAVFHVLCWLDREP